MVVVEDLVLGFCKLINMKVVECKLKGRVRLTYIVLGYVQKVEIVGVFGDQMIGIADVDFGKQSFVVFLFDEIDSIIYV